jgi:hypothetical protein
MGRTTERSTGKRRSREATGKSYNANEEESEGIAEERIDVRSTTGKGRGEERKCVETRRTRTDGPDGKGTGTRGKNESEVEVGKSEEWWSGKSEKGDAECSSVRETEKREEGWKVQAI